MVWQVMPVDHGNTTVVVAASTRSQLRRFCFGDNSLLALGNGVSTVVGGITVIVGPAT